MEHATSAARAFRTDTPNGTSGCPQLSRSVMTEPPTGPDPARDREEADRRTAGLAAIVVVLVLLIGGLLLARTLRKTSLLEDCLMAGHRDCDRMLDGAR
jgi:hypothetical protein